MTPRGSELQTRSNVAGARGFKSGIRVGQIAYFSMANPTALGGGSPIDDDRGAGISLDNKVALQALEQQLDHRMQCIEERFNEIITQFRALGLEANRNRNGGRLRDREDSPLVWPIDRPLPVY